jgi:hypothetical protein
MTEDADYCPDRSGYLEENKERERLNWFLENHRNEPLAVCHQPS